MSWKRVPPFFGTGCCGKLNWTALMELMDLICKLFCVWWWWWWWWGGLVVGLGGQWWLVVVGGGLQRGVGCVGWWEGPTAISTMLGKRALPCELGSPSQILVTTSVVEHTKVKKVANFWAYFAHPKKFIFEGPSFMGGPLKVTIKKQLKKLGFDV